MLQRMFAVGSSMVLGVTLTFGADIWTSSSSLSSSTSLTAAQVIEKNVAARGGLAAWKSVEALSMSGKLEAGGNDQPDKGTPVKIGGQVIPERRPATQVQLPFRMELKRGYKSRIEIDFRGQTAIQVYDGSNGWKLRPFLNRHQVEQFTAEEMKAAAKQAELDGPLVDYAAKGTRAELEGTEQVEGKTAYRLKLTLKNGETERLWIDSESFLETKIEGTPRRLDGKYHAVEVYYRDYKTVNGLQISYLMETKVEGVKQTEKITIEKVAVNPKLDDTRFAKLL